MRRKITQYERLVKNGIFSGSKEEYDNLTEEEKNKLVNLLNIIHNMFELRNFGIFSGTFEEFLQLSESEQDKIIEKYNIKKEELSELEKKRLQYDRFLKIVPSYDGTFEDYIKLSDKEREKIRVDYLIKQYRSERTEVLNDIEKCFNNLKNDNNEYDWEKEYNFKVNTEKYNNELKKLSSLFKNRIKLVDFLNNNGHNVPDDLKMLIDVNINKPKFGFFDNKKYKLLDSLLTDEYIYKLKTRQIDSDFQTDADYNDKSKWKAFVDKKEKEYQQLHNQIPPIYLGSLEEYLQESTLVTFEYLKFGNSSTKIMENASKFRRQQEMQNQKRIEEANQISEITANYAAELHNIMNGPSARNLAQHSARALSEILDDSEKQKKSSPYSYKPGPKGNGEYDGTFGESTKKR